MFKFICSMFIFTFASVIFMLKFINVKANDKEFTYPYTSINASIRSTNQLIIYTYDYKNKTVDGYTGTNSYGYEAAVDNTGVVIDVSTHVLIPVGGFVLSGHGIAAEFIRNNIEVGTMVSYDINTKLINVVNSVVDSELFSTKVQLTKAYEIIENAKTKLLDVNLEAAILSYNKAKELHDEALLLSIVDDAKLIIAKCKEAKKLLLDVIYYTMPSHTLEARAIWHRPNEYNLSQIQSNLDKMQELGINLIYVETLWGYYSNYQSEILDIHPNIAYNTYGEFGKDYLKAFITEAHNRGIEVHAWAEIFSMYKHSKIAKLHPEWLLINEDGSKDNGQGYFLDPANPEVRAFIITIIRELLSKYQVDGFQYDYIRYPSEDEVKTGYTEYAMNEFKSLYGLVGDVRQLIKDPLNKHKWDMYRQNVISQTVQEMTSVVREYPGVNISMAVAPEAKQAKKVYMQDFTTWIKNGWIDTIAPMVYVADPEHVKSIALEIQSYTKNLTYQYTGIAPVYFGFPVLTNQEQIVKVNEVALGNAMFASHNLIGNSEFEQALKLSTNRKKSVLPHADTNLAVEEVLNDILSQGERIFIPNHKMTDMQNKELGAEFNRIKTMKKSNAKELYELKDRLFVLTLYMDNYALGEAVNRINEQLNRLIMVLDIKISQDLIHREYWNPGNDNQRPDVYSFDYPNVDDIFEPQEEQNDETIEPSINLNKIFIFGSLILGSLASGLSLYRLKRK